jgi:hypothetical protein
MDNLPIKKTDRGFEIHGFPDALKVVRLDGPKSKRLADLALHKSDLDFALECLTAIAQVSEDSPVVREALWRSAVIHFMKCFGSSKARTQLNAKKVYSGDPGAMEPFRYFASLRNRHIAHDENPFTQCIPGAVLNRKEANRKVAKIACMAVVGVTLSQENYSNLNLLTSRARDWVIRQFDELCDLLTSELEKLPHESLASREAIVYSPPEADDVHALR